MGDSTVSRNTTAAGTDDDVSLSSRAQLQMCPAFKDMQRECEVMEQGVRLRKGDLIMATKEQSGKQPRT